MSTEGNVGVYRSHQWAQRECGCLWESSMDTEGMWGFMGVINEHRVNMGVYRGHQWAQREYGGLKRSSMSTEGMWGFMEVINGHRGNVGV